TDSFRVIGRRTDPTNDRVAEALLPHVLEAGEQHGCANSVFSCLRFHAGRAEEIAKSSIMAGKSYDLAVMDRNEARNWLAAERDFGFARPFLGEILTHPGGDLMLLGSQGAADRDTKLGQPLNGGPGLRQIVKPN